MPTIYDKNGDAYVKFYQFDPSELVDDDECPSPVVNFARESSASIGCIGEIFVAETSRKQGVGTGLLTQALKALQNGGCDRVYLLVDSSEDVDRLVRWYRQFGFQHIGTQGYKTPEGTAYDVFMGRTLTKDDVLGRQKT